MYLVFVFPKGQYESKYGSESDSMKEVEKQNNPLLLEQFSWYQSPDEGY